MSIEIMTGMASAIYLMQFRGSPGFFVNVRHGSANDRLRYIYDVFSLCKHTFSLNFRKIKNHRTGLCVFVYVCICVCVIVTACEICILIWHYIAIDLGEIIVFVIQSKSFWYVNNNIYLSRIGLSGIGLSFSVSKNVISNWNEFTGVTWSATSISCSVNYEYVRRSATSISCIG